MESSSQPSVNPKAIEHVDRMLQRKRSPLCKELETIILTAMADLDVCPECKELHYMGNEAVRISQVDLTGKCIGPEAALSSIIGCALGIPGLSQTIVCSEHIRELLFSSVQRRIRKGSKALRMKNGNTIVVNAVSVCTEIRGKSTIKLIGLDAVHRYADEVRKQAELHPEGPIRPKMQLPQFGHVVYCLLEDEIDEDTAAVVVRRSVKEQRKVFCIYSLPKVVNYNDSGCARIFQQSIITEHLISRCPDCDDG